MHDYNWFKGDKIKVGIYGESHSESIGVRLEGLMYSSLDEDKLRAFMRRRAPGNNAWSTPRKEADEVIIDKLENGVFEAHILNTNIRPADYSDLLRTPRPSHADFTAGLKYGPDFKSSGGGAFSGRLTAPMCIAGFLSLSYLAQKGIRISSRIKEIGGIKDASLDLDKLREVRNKEFPVIDDQKGEEMKKAIEEARLSEDSVGGIIETVIEGLPGGIGGPIFEGIEGKIAQICFAIPAVKGIEFGNGFEAARLKGSDNNDSLVYEDGKLKLETNRCGGILGGISVGGDVAPVIFDCAVKPTPTIGKEQRTVDLLTGENTTLKAKGRHDPCIVPRAVPVFEAAAALAIADLI